MERYQLMITFIVIIALFFILSALLMALWNGSVRKAFKTGTIKKIGYPTAMGMMLFLSLFSTSSFYVTK